MHKLPLPAHNMCPSPEKKKPFKCFSTGPPKGELFNIPNESDKRKQKLLRGAEDSSEGRSGHLGRSRKRGRHRPVGPGTTGTAHLLDGHKGCSWQERLRGAALEVSLVWVRLGVPQVRALPKGGHVLSCHPLSSCRVCWKDIPVVGHRCSGFSDKSLAGAVLGVRANYDALNHTQGTQPKTNQTIRNNNNNNENPQFSGRRVNRNTKMKKGVFPPRPGPTVHVFLLLDLSCFAQIS